MADTDQILAYVTVSVVCDQYIPIIYTVKQHAAFDGANNTALAYLLIILINHDRLVVWCVYKIHICETRRLHYRLHGHTLSRPREPAILESPIEEEPHCQALSRLDPWGRRGWPMTCARRGRRLARRRRDDGCSGVSGIPLPFCLISLLNILWHCCLFPSLFFLLRNDMLIILVFLLNLSVRSRGFFFEKFGG
jgi:hypothetical protein